MIINGNLDLRDCNYFTSLGKLKEIEGDLFCAESLKNLSDLEYVGRNLFLYKCNKLKSLGDLKHVGNYLVCPNKLEDLGDLEYVGGNLNLRCCINLKSLGKLKEIKGNIYLRNSSIVEEYVKENYPQFLDKCNW